MSSHNRIKKNIGVPEWWAIRSGKILTGRDGTVLGEVLRRRVCLGAGAIWREMRPREKLEATHHGPQAWRAQLSWVNHRDSTISLISFLHSTNNIECKPIHRFSPECWAWWAGRTPTLLKLALSAWGALNRSSPCSILVGPSQKRGGVEVGWRGAV